MIEEHDYEISLEGSGPKSGAVTASDVVVVLDVASPPEFGGPEGLWSPEHLYVAAVSSCLMTTFQAIAAASSVDVVSYVDQATGHLQRGEDRMYRMDRITLRPTIKVPATQVDRALRIIEKAERACLISRSVNSEILLEPDVSAG